MKPKKKFNPKTKLQHAQWKYKFMLKGRIEMVKNLLSVLKSESLIQPYQYFNAKAVMNYAKLMCDAKFSDILDDEKTRKEMGTSKDPTMNKEL